MALLPIAFQCQIDEDGNVSFQVEQGKRLGASHLWMVASLLEHAGDDLHAKDRAAIEPPGRPQLVVAGALPSNGRAGS